MLHVTRYANDFDRTRTEQPDTNAFPDRVLTRKGRARQFFIHDGNKRARRLIVLIQSASTQQRNAHRSEMLRAYRIEPRRPYFRGTAAIRSIVWSEPYGCVSHEGEAAHLQTREFHSRDCGQSLVQFMK